MFLVLVQNKYKNLENINSILRVFYNYNNKNKIVCIHPKL